MILFIEANVRYKNRYYTFNNYPISVKETEHNGIYPLNSRVEYDLKNNIEPYLDYIFREAKKYIHVLNPINFNKKAIITYTLTYVEDTSTYNGYCNVVKYVYLYNYKTMTRYICDGPNIYRCEETNNDKLYNIGDKVLFKYPIEDKYDTGIIHNVYESDYGITYSIDLNDHISLYQVHNNDILNILKE